MLIYTHHLGRSVIGAHIASILLGRRISLGTDSTRRSLTHYQHIGATAGIYTRDIVYRFHHRNFHHLFRVARAVARISIYALQMCDLRGANSWKHVRASRN